MGSAELRSGSSRPRGLRGMRRLITANESPLRTFQRLAPPARVEDENLCPGQVRGQEYACMCVYICGCVSLW